MLQQNDTLDTFLAREWPKWKDDDYKPKVVWVLEENTFTNEGGWTSELYFMNVFTSFDAAFSYELFERDADFDCLLESEDWPANREKLIDGAKEYLDHYKDNPDPLTWTTFKSWNYIDSNEAFQIKPVELQTSDDIRWMMFINDIL